MSQPEKLPKVDLFLGSYSVVIAENSSNMSKNNILNLLRIKVMSNVQIKNIASFARVTTESTCTTYQNLLSIDLQNKMNNQRNISPNSGFMYKINGSCTWFCEQHFPFVRAGQSTASPQRNVSSLLNCF